MTLSICLITRDAERNIERLLHSVAPLQAQVLVADTGSHDRTVAAAQARGATVFTVPWQDDFAAAQNLALDHATGDWVLWLNPDEELLPHGLEELPALLARPEVLAAVVRIQQVTDPDRPDQTFETWYPRLFRRHPAIRFTGRLHPHFTVPLEELAQRERLEIFRSGLVVRHHAYLSILTGDKLRWATRLLELELKDRPGQLHYLIEYGRNLLRLNDPKGHVVLAEAAEQVLAGQDAAVAPTATVAMLFEYLFTVSPEQSLSRLSPAQAEQLAQRWFPASPPMLWALAQRAHQSGRYREAIPFLEQLVHLGRTGAYDRTAGFDLSILREPAILNLGTCYHLAGDLDRAELCFALLFSSPTHQDRARQGYSLVQAARRNRQTP